LPVTTSGGFGPLLFARRSTTGSLIVAPPSEAELLAGFWSTGPAAAMVAVLTGAPAVMAVVLMTMLPRSTLLPAPLPEARVAVTVWPVTVTIQPGATTLSML
jgi:hypothetical protein